MLPGLPRAFLYVPVHYLCLNGRNRPSAGLLHCPRPHACCLLPGLLPPALLGLKFWLAEKIAGMFIKPGHRLTEDAIVSLVSISRAIGYFKTLSC